MLTFVCVTLISVKSKYGSCNGNCTGLIKYKQRSKYLFSIDICVTYIYTRGKIAYVGLT